MKKKEPLKKNPVKPEVEPTGKDDNPMPKPPPIK